jgi:hypothetical protein
MARTLLGALLVLAGLLCGFADLAGRMSDVRRTSAASPEPTLEPPKPGAGFYAKENLLGIVSWRWAARF